MTGTLKNTGGAAQFAAIYECAKSSISGRNFAEAASDILQRLADYFKCDRACVFEFDWSAGTFSNCCEKCAPGISSRIESAQELPLENIDFWVKAFKDKSVLHMDGSSFLPGADQIVRGTLSARGVRELYAVPFSSLGTLRGFLSVENPQADKDNTQMLEIMGGFIFSAMEKQRVQGETETALGKYKAVLANIHGGLTIMELDKNTGLAVPKFANDNFISMLGISEREFYEYYGKDAFHGIHPDDRQRVEKEFLCAFNKKGKFSSVYRLIDGRGEYLWVRVSASSVPEKSGRALFYLLYSDITEEKIREQRYNNELVLREQTLDGRAVCAFRYNLTRDVMETYSSASETLSLGKDSRLDEIIEKMAANITSAKQREEFISKLSWTALVDAYIGSTDSVEYECQMLMPSGKIAWIHNSVKMLKQPRTGCLIAFFAARDVTMEHVSSDMLHTVAQKDYDFIIYLDVKHDSYIMFSSADNSAGNQLQSLSSKYYETDAAGYIKKYVSDEDIERALQCMTIENITAQLNGKDSYELTLRVKAANGGTRIKKFQYVYQDREDGIVILSGSDITDIFLQLEENQRLTDIAHRDLLTGLLNKEYFCRVVGEIAAKPGCKSLFFIDIDNFKTFNDKLGHLVGDKVLRDVAATLTSIFRKDDLVGRFGGDEFMVLLHGATVKMARAKAEKICSALQREYANEGCSISLTVSVGVSSASSRSTANQLLDMADKALYLAKKKGKNCWACYEETQG